MNNTTQPYKIYLYDSLDIVKDQQLANNLFDCSVNQGEGLARKFMQIACNLKSEMNDLRYEQQTTERVNEIRLKVLESRVNILEEQVQEIKLNKQLTPKS